MIENIVRALIFRGEKDEILLTRQKGADYTFLPGGHIEFGETARQALDREMVEEIGTEGFMGIPLFTVENLFTDAENKPCHEIATYFTYSFYKRFYTEKVVPVEDHLEMFWVHLNDLHHFNLKPKVLTELITEFFHGSEISHFITETESGNN